MIALVIFFCFFGGFFTVKGFYDAFDGEGLGFLELVVGVIFIAIGFSL